jgi:hypothetical protein
MNNKNVEKLSSSSSDQSLPATRWKVLLSSQLNRPFYYDSIKKTGQFSVPVDLQSSEAAASPNRDVVKSSSSPSVVRRSPLSSDEKKRKSPESNYRDHEEEEGVEEGDRDSRTYLSRNAQHISLTSNEQEEDLSKGEDEERNQASTPSYKSLSIIPLLDETSSSSGSHLLRPLPIQQPLELLSQSQSQSHSQPHTPSSPAAGWICSACTYFNLKSQENCEICETVNPNYQNRLRRSQRKSTIMTSPAGGGPVSQLSQQQPHQLQSQLPFSQSKRKKTTR